MSQGVFTCGELVEIQVLADSIWKDDRRKIDYIANAETARAILENQTAVFTELENPDKDREISAKWLNACSIVVEDCGDECTTTGPELEGQCQTYSLTQCKEVNFTVKHFESRTSIFDTKMKVATGMLKAKKALDEFISQRAILEIDSFGGVNAHTGGIGTVSGATTTIPAANWTMGLMSYFSLVKRKNKFMAPFLLSGANLFEANINAGFNAGNDNGKGDAARAGFLPIYFDVENIDTVLSPDKQTFMIDKGAVGIYSKAYYKNYSEANPQDWRHLGLRWSVKSDNLQGIMYDVFYNISCSGSEITHTFKIKTKFDVFLNPVGCTTTNTGVLNFQCS